MRNRRAPHVTDLFPFASDKKPVSRSLNRYWTSERLRRPEPTPKQTTHTWNGRRNQQYSGWIWSAQRITESNRLLLHRQDDWRRRGIWGEREEGKTEEIWTGDRKKPKQIWLTTEKRREDNIKWWETRKDESRRWLLLKALWNLYRERRKNGENSLSVGNGNRKKNKKH